MLKRIRASFLLAAGFFTVCLSQVNAQQPTTIQPTQPTEEIKNADVAITANVTARELKFEVVPNPKVEFPGTEQRITVWEAERQNLPKPVEPGVTYRDIGIQLRITSRFADIERIVAEALGEIPVTDQAVSPEKKPANPPLQNPTNRNKPR